MFNTCLRMVGSFETAEEILQDAFVDAFLHLDRFDHRVEFGAWLKRIVINKSINALRAQQIIYQELDERYDVLETKEEEESVEWEVSRIRDEMEKLPLKARMVFSLYMLEGYDHEEIATIMDISTSTSKTQLKRAKGKIKEALKSMSYER
jgi:RNA polymerase sigma factor (sigma-70 family)